MSKIGYRTESEKRECKELAYKMLEEKCGELQADIDRMAKENKGLKEDAKADSKEIERLLQVITQVCEEREQVLKEP